MNSLEAGFVGQSPISNFVRHYNWSDIDNCLKHHKSGTLKQDCPLASWADAEAFFDRLSFSERVAQAFGRGPTGLSLNSVHAYLKIKYP